MPITAFLFKMMPMDLFFRNPKFHGLTMIQQTATKTDVAEICLEIEHLRAENNRAIVEAKNDILNEVQACCLLKPI